MAAPTISTITPATGLSIGENCVIVEGTGFNDLASGGSIRVLFGGVESPEYGVIDSTRVIALTPPGEVGTADLTIENIGAGGAPVEGTTVADAFTYTRPDLQTNRDLSASPDSALLVVTRQLVKELRRTVIENVQYDMHPEYVDAESAALGIEKQAVAPSLKIVGPTVTEDPFYRINGRFAIETLAGAPGGAEFLAYTQPVTVRMEFQFVGVGRTKGEAVNLWNALTLFFDRTPDLEIPLDGEDKANGTISFEINPDWDQRGEFQSTNRQGFYQFSGAFSVRGIQTVSRPLCESRGADDLIVTPEQIP